jgi:hypothetical protein
MRVLLMNQYSGMCDRLSSQIYARNAGNSSDSATLGGLNSYLLTHINGVIDTKEILQIPKGWRGQ